MAMRWRCDGDAGATMSPPNVDVCWDSPVTRHSSLSKPMLDAWNIVGLVAFPLLLAANGFFVSAEFALVAVRKTRMQELERKGFTGAGLVLLAIEHLDRFIAATQLGITLASL